MPDLSEIMAAFGGTSGEGGLDPTQVGNESKRLGALSSLADAKREQAMGGIRNTSADLVKAIEDTTAELRKSHEGQWNLPLMAFGAGMLHTTPGIASNFGNEVGHGLENAVPAIANQRQRDQEFWGKIADLQRARGEAAVMPDRLEADYQGKISQEAQKLLSALNVAGMRSDKPIIVPGTGEVIYPNQFGAGKHGIKLPGQSNITPMTAGASPSAPPATAESRNYTNEPSEETAGVLKTINPQFDPSKIAFSANWDKLAEIAKTDPDKANGIYKALMYESDPLQFLSKRGQMGQHTFEDAEKFMRTFDPNWSYSDLQAAIKNRNSPDWNTKTNVPPQQLSTGIEHMGELIDAYEKLGNNPNQLVNWLKNKVKEVGGSADVTNQAVVSKFVGDEVAKYLAGGQGSALADREELSKLLSGKLSPDQAKQAIDHMLLLMNDKAKSYASQKTEMLKNRRIFTADDLLYPDAKVSRDKIGKSIVALWDGKPKLFVPGVTQDGGHTWLGGDPTKPESWSQ